MYIYVYMCKDIFSYMYICIYIYIYIGKTTSAASWGSLLSDSGLKTLVISTDPAHSLGIYICMYKYVCVFVCVCVFVYI
jgi:hypothetical protein